MSNHFCLGKKNQYMELILGAMKTGKSDEMHTRYRHAKVLNLDVKLFTLSIDNKFKEEFTKLGMNIDPESIGYGTRTGKIYPKEDVYVVKNLDELVRGIEETKPKVALIEEVALYGITNPLKDVADYLEMLVQEKNKIVIATVLPSDSDGNDFFGVCTLLSKADVVTPMKPAICTYKYENGELCGNPASKNKCFVTKDSTVKIGDDIYGPRCRHHWKVEESKP